VITQRTVPVLAEKNKPLNLVPGKESNQFYLETKLYVTWQILQMKTMI